MRKRRLRFRRPSLTGIALAMFLGAMLIMAIGKIVQEEVWHEAGAVTFFAGCMILGLSVPIGIIGFIRRPRKKMRAADA
jgi:hypothetical protein